MDNPLLGYCFPQLSQGFNPCASKTSLLKVDKDNEGYYCKSGAVEVWLWKLHSTLLMGGYIG